MSNDLADLMERISARSRQLKAGGMASLQATQTAWLEERILEWPAAWGDDLHVLLFGDLKEPNEAIAIPSLRITIHPGKQEKTVIRALCVLQATVGVDEKSVLGVMDAVRRLNVLLGAQALVGWSHGAIGWWSWITHGTSASIQGELNSPEMPKAIDCILKLRSDVRRKIEAALYWIREPQSHIMEGYRRVELRTFVAHWNAFECLVDAVNLVRPYKKLTREEKQSRIDALVKQRKGALKAADIQQCYQEVVNPGFVGKATHALKECFGSEADAYIRECFKLPKKVDQLYDIRNAINHGEIDAEDLAELIRVDCRHTQLWMIVWGMFGRFITFAAPSDPKRTQ